MDDGLLEIIALDNLDLALLHLHGTGKAICQCKKAIIRTTKAIPMQVDGEPCLMQPCCSIKISQDLEVAKSGVMLSRNKEATCKIGI